MLTAKRREFVVARALIRVRQPADLGGTFGASVDRAAVSLSDVVGAAHQALVFCAVPHREHMSRFVCRDL